MNFKYTKVIITIIIFAIVIILIPLFFKIPILKETISFWLSYTENDDYKITYIQLVVTFLSNFISIYGTLWIYKSTTKYEAIKKQKNNVFIIYCDLKNSLDVLLQTIHETKYSYNLEKINIDDLDKFCCIACGKDLNLSNMWLTYISQLDLVLKKIEILQLFKCYEKLLTINSAFKSDNPQKIKDIYTSHICWFVTCDEKSLHPDIERLLDILYFASK